MGAPGGVSWSQPLSWRDACRLRGRPRLQNQVTERVPPGAERGQDRTVPPSSIGRQGHFLGPVERRGSAYTHFFFFLFWLPSAYGVPRLGLIPSCSWDLSHSCSGSLTHRARPGIKPVSQRCQDDTNSIAPQWELFFFSFFRAAPIAYGGSQARDRIRAIADGLHHSNHSTATRDLSCICGLYHSSAMPDPLSKAHGY